MKIKFSILVVIVLTILLAVLLIVRSSSENKIADKAEEKQIENMVEDFPGATPKNINLTEEVSWAQPRVPVLIYSEVVKTTQTNERSFPTVKIWRKVGTSPYEPLAVVGKVDEYPINIKLSTDKQFLLINLESKLQLLNLETKELRDIFIPENSTYLGAVFSPNGKELFIWDQYYARQDKSQYIVHRLNLETLQDTVLATGSDGSMYGPVVWRKDDRVVLYEPMGEFSRSWYFDLSTNQVLPTPGHPMSGFVSSDGTLMSIVNNHVEDICNEFSGDAWSGYTVIDPVTGKVHGGLKQQGRPAEINTFSFDGMQIIYSVGENIMSKEDCGRDIKPATYFVSQLDGSKSAKIDRDTSLRLMNEWGYGSIGAEEHYDYDNNTYSITINNKPIVSSSKTLGIVAQYLK